MWCEWVVHGGIGAANPPAGPAMRSRIIIMETGATKNGIKSLFVLYEFKRFGFEEFPVLKKIEMRTSGFAQPEPGTSGISGFPVVE
jgi:hypothetical protein